VRLASAPVTWGVWERTVGRDDLVPPELLLETMRGLGYTATELGPPGYFTPQLLERHEMRSSAASRRSASRTRARSATTSRRGSSP